MSSAERIKDAKRALGKEAENYEIEYEEKPEDSDTGRPQLILFGEIIEHSAINHLKPAGFEFLCAQTAEFDEEEEDDEDEEKDGDLEIVFEDMRAGSRR